MYYRIGEVSAKTGVPPHILRYWETVFPQLAPRKGFGGQRLYREEDLRFIEKVRVLLYEKRYTLQGVKKILEGGNKTSPPPELVRYWVEELKKVRDILSSFSGRSAAR